MWGEKYIKGAPGIKQNFWIDKTIWLPGFQPALYSQLQEGSLLALVGIISLGRSRRQDWRWLDCAAGREDMGTLHHLGWKAESLQRSVFAPLLNGARQPEGRVPRGCVRPS